MRVLHITNVAGVPGLLVKGLRQRGIIADLIERKQHPYGFSEGTVINVPFLIFLFFLLRLSRNYDIIHLHSLSYRAFNIDVFALKTLGAKLVIHLHGTGIRKSHNRPWTKAALKICNQVLISTPDLLFYYPKAIWLPNPIDPIFKPLKNPQRHGKALVFKKWYEPGEENVVQMKCDKMGLELTVQRKPIPYNEMPLLLNQFEVFFDRFTIPSLSKTALEALACGCKVIGWKGPITNPEEILQNHSLQAVTQKLIDIYEKVLHE